MKKISIFLIFLVIIALTGCNSSHDANTHSHENMANETMNANSADKKDFKAELKAEPSAIKANEAVKFTLSVKNTKGETVKDFDIVHEKVMHVLLVSEDLAEFYHEHPTLQPDGSLAFDFTFKNGGKYFIYADYKPKGTNGIVDRLPIEVEGNARLKEELKADEKFEKTVDSLRVVMSSGGVNEANKELMLDFTVYDAASGAIANDLENYLGEKAHFVVISKDLKDFVHAHPMAPDKMRLNETAKDDKPTVSAHITFPNAGLFKLWAQFQRNGKVINVPFVVDVKQGKAEKLLTEAKIPEGYQKIVVSKDGFTPNEVTVSKNKPIKLAFLRIDAENCGDEIVFNDYEIKKELPVGEVVKVEIENPKSNEINFACGMKMLSGKIIVQ